MDCDGSNLGVVSVVDILKTSAGLLRTLGDFNPGRSRVQRHRNNPVSTVYLPRRPILMASKTALAMFPKRFPLNAVSPNCESGTVLRNSPFAIRSVVVSEHHGTQSSGQTQEHTHKGTRSARHFQ